MKGNYSEGADHHFNIGDYNKALSYNDSLYKITFHLYSTTENKLLKGRYIKQLEDMVKTDVIELLNVSKNKQEALNIYLMSAFQRIQK